jgi:hypothetical protein
MMSQNSCDGSSSSTSGPRGGASPGGSCTSSSECQQATCQCANGTVYYAAQCVNGRCDNSNACSCVEQLYSNTFMKQVCG